jgi:hypothetical protein
MDKYRIIEHVYTNGGTKYVLEKQLSDSEWMNVYAHTDLEVIREAKAKREGRHIVESRVIE